MNKKHDKLVVLYRDTMTTAEVIQAVKTINSPLAASKWLKRNKITPYPIDGRVSVWDRDEVMKCLNSDSGKK